MDTRRFVPLLLIVPLLVVGCRSETEQAADTEPPATTAAQEAAMTDEEAPAEWGYTGDAAPQNWATLDEAYAACAGTQQSPVDLAANDEAQEVAIQLDYTAAEGRLLDTGHGVQVNVEGGTMTIDGKAFALKQFHFHTPSEHTLDGQSYPAEAHLVHVAEDGELAVLGLFYEEGPASTVLAPVWEDLPDLGDADPTSINVADMLPSAQVAYTYTGSLTTPPCSEGVRWHVMEQPLTMSAEQLRALTAIHDDNNRPVQPLNERALDRVTL
jgi:carbonic anhydrase